MIETGGGQRFPVPFEPAYSGRVVRSGDVGDPPAAALDQMLGRQPANSLVIGAHVGRAWARNSAVHQHVRHPARFDFREYFFRVRRLHRRQDQAIHLARQQTFDLARLQAGIFFGIADHHVVTERPHGAGYAFGDFGEKRVHQVRHHQPHDERAPRRQAARHPIGLVVQFLDAGENAAACLGTDIGAAPHNFRDGHNRDVQVLGYVFQSHWRIRRIWHGRTGGAAAITVSA